MKILFLLVLILVLLLFCGCPTPWGVLYGDQIIHWNGENEKITTWLKGDTEMTTVTIELEWPGD